MPWSMLYLVVRVEYKSEAERIKRQAEITPDGGDECETFKRLFMLLRIDFNFPCDLYNYAAAAAN